jgi:hypothetical protein
MKRFDHLKSEISNLKLKVEACSRQLRGWADHLQNTPIRGQRHLNERTREEFDQAQRADAFRVKLQRMRANQSPQPSSETNTQSL